MKCNDGAISLANSLTNNNKLHELHLFANQIDQSVQNTFSCLLCNTTSINNTYSSNHTLHVLDLGVEHNWQHLESLLRMNENTNKSHVAIKKILKYHPIIDMELLFEWGADEEGEHTLKALPYVVSWFDRAKEAVAEEDGESYSIGERKLSAIFQFAKAMPLLLEGISQMKMDDNRKRKREA